MGKDKDKDKKSTKSSKSKDKSEKDKKSKGSKSEKERKSSKSGRSEKSATPSKDKSKSKVDDDKSTKSRKTSKSKSKRDRENSHSPAPSQLDVESQLKSQLDADILNKGGATLTDMAGLGGANKLAGAEMAGGYNTASAALQSESPFRVQPVLNAHVMQKQSCLLHNKPLRYFCDSCEELLCYDCTVMGPHNTQLHRICNIEEAFRYRFDQVNKSIHQSLVPKRAQLIGQIVRLDHRLDEIKTVKQVIERDIRNEYAGVMERLKSAEGVKTAVLQHDIAEVQKDITRIDEILMFMEDIATGGAAN